jgi:bis(5'-nucleosyl)-tetraphosphatase (symmetrical)
MNTYAIGDLQGCLNELRRLLDELRFDPSGDRLWFVGDLVNRGFQSLETLRFVKSLGGAAVTVLGNHDLHALAVFYGDEAKKSKDTLDELLAAPDVEVLMEWLRHRPMLHHEPELRTTMIHAGLSPQWTLEEARGLAAEMEQTLRGPQVGAFFSQMYGDEPASWSPQLNGWERLRFITNCLTRIRYCREDGTLDLKTKTAPGHQPEGLYEWFNVPGRRSAGQRLVFGHWSTLGARVLPDAIALDSGCVWGGRLTAVRLEDPEPRLVSLDCEGALTPGEGA